MSFRRRIEPTARSSPSAGALSFLGSLCLTAVRTHWCPLSAEQAVWLFWTLAFCVEVLRWWDTKLRYSLCGVWHITGPIVAVTLWSLHPAGRCCPMSLWGDVGSCLPPPATLENLFQFMSKIQCPYPSVRTFYWVLRTSSYACPSECFWVDTTPWEQCSG